MPRPSAPEPGWVRAHGWAEGRSLATETRRIALALLAERPGTPLADRLARPAVEALDPRERALLHELVLGTLRLRGRLDHALAPCLERPLEQIDRFTIAALRLGAHQLLHLRVPAHAAVSESVSLMRERGSQASGLVNAVLRRLDRDGPRAPLDPVADPIGWLTSEGSLPRWLAQRWVDRLGAEMSVRRARAMTQEPPASFRINPRQGDPAAIVAALEALPGVVPGSWRARSGPVLEMARQGLIYLQDEGSQLVAALAATGAPRVLDACAAPGGKALLIADTGSRVIALERSARRRRTLSLLVDRWGAGDRVHVVGADASRPPFDRPFDVVLLDAPCSGLGTLGRHPDIRWSATEQDFPRQAARQSRLLRALAPLTAPEGRLVYATCSLEPEENDEIVTSFLEDHPGFEPDPTAIPEWAKPMAGPVLVQTEPAIGGGDGFSAAVLRRRR